MSNLGDKLIKDSYPGLIKTSDEGAIGSTPKRLQDGEGNQLPIDVTTTQTRFYGTADFTNATVTGISGGGGGAVDSVNAGTGISVDTTTGDVTVTNSAPGEYNTASNVGAGEGVFKLKVGSDLEFKTLTAGSNITLTGSADEIEISASGGGGGGTFNTNIKKYGTGTGLNSGNDGPYTFFTDIILFYPFRAEQGAPLDIIKHTVRTAYTGGDRILAIYNTQDATYTEINRGTYGYFLPYERLTETDIVFPSDASGFIDLDVSSLGFVFPYTGFYWLAVKTPGVWDGVSQSATNALWQSATYASYHSQFTQQQTNTLFKVQRTGPDFQPVYTVADWAATAVSSSSQCWILESNQ